MKKHKNKNPLNRRILRELVGDWKKYIVVSLFLILTIGFVSGMYIANGSMMSAAEQGSTKYKLEHGHFELEKKADAEFLKEISAGQKADVKSYYLKKAKDELDEKFEKEFRNEFSKKFDAEFAGKFDASFAQQIRNSLLAQGMNDKAASKALPAVLKQAKESGRKI